MWDWPNNCKRDKKKGSIALANRLSQSIVVLKITSYRKRNRASCPDLIRG